MIRAAQVVTWRRDSLECFRFRETVPTHYIQHDLSALDGSRKVRIIVDGRMDGWMDLTKGHIQRVETIKSGARSKFGLLEQALLQYGAGDIP